MKAVALALAPLLLVRDLILATILSNFVHLVFGGEEVELLVSCRVVGHHLYVIIQDAGPNKQ